MRKSKVILTKRTLLISSISLLMIVALGVSVQQIAAAQARIITPGPNPDHASIKALEKNLENPNLDETTKKSLQGKLEVYSKNATRQANILSRATNIPNGPKAAPQIPTIKASQRMTGIINRPAVPFPSSAFQIENAWQEKVNGTYILVFAGVDAVRSDKGILIITSDTNRHFEYFYTPTDSGPVKIVDVKGMQLVLKTKGKEVFYFDVLGRRFVSSLGEVVSTATPNPTDVSIATPSPDTPVPAYP